MHHLFLVLVVISLGMPSLTFAQTGTCTPAFGEAMLDVGNVRARLFNNGALFWRGSPHIYEVPKGSGTNALFASSFWLGGLVKDTLRISASRYGHYEFWAGPLDDDGQPPADCSAYDRIYSVKRSEILAYEHTGQATPDLAEWPTGLGAPTLDATGRNIDLSHLPFQVRDTRTINLAAGERPAITGDQIAWWVMNDLGNVHRSTDGLPLGVEVQVNAFAYDTLGPLGNTTFYRYRIHYRGATYARQEVQSGPPDFDTIEISRTLNTGPLEQAYVTLFMDPDLGNFTDDYVGSDPELGLGYVYNEDNDDEGGEGYGIAPPAIGGDIVRGPNNDYGLTRDDFDFGQIAFQPDLRRNRLPMTSFTMHNGGGCVTCDPTRHTEYYNYMRARWRDGNPLTHGGNGYDFSELRTTFFMPSDPTSGAFWSELNIDNEGTPSRPHDQKFMINAGPFRMEIGEVETVDFAITWARGIDHLDSVTRLKQANRAIQAFVDDGYRLPSGPDAPILDATPLGELLLLQWHNPASSNNADDTYHLKSNLFSLEETIQPYELEGYDVFQFANATDTIGTRIATYDRTNGTTNVIEGDELTYQTAFGSDSGLQHHHVFENLTPYRTYYFGVQAYAYSPDYRPRIYRGSMARISITTAPQAGTAFGQTQHATLGQALNINGPPALTVSVLDPTALIANDYILVTYTIGDQFSYDLLTGDGTILFDGNAWYERTARTPPLAPEPLVIDGLRIEVSRDAPTDEMWRFSTNGLTPQTSAETGQTALAQIGMSPNPYKVVSAYEVRATQSEVRFTGMPERASIRVYTLNGTLVQTLEKNSPEAWLAWDLRTAEGREIGSGVYLIHVEVPGIGTRVLRFAVVR